MTALAPNALSVNAAPDAPARDVPLGLLVLLQPALFAVPLVVLGSAIGWPASLGYPAHEILPLIAEQRAAVTLGYWAYLLVSIAMIPLAFALRAHLAAQGLRHWSMDALAFAGAAAGVLKTLGIVRWLSVMPMLADEWLAADAGQRAGIELAYRAANEYAGHVGELLGVQLMSGFWMAGLGLALMATGRRVTGAGGVLAGGLTLLLCLRTAGVPVEGLAMFIHPVSLLWLIILGAGFLRRA